MVSVDVVVFSHNHEEFIEEALQGILAQNTSAAVNIRVHDDASTDGTASIARTVLEKSGVDFELVVAKENKYRHGSSFKYDFALQSTSDFVAFLDADDYWTDSNKLQAQIDFLQADPSVALCHTAFLGIDSRGNPISFRPKATYLQPKIHGHRLSEENFIGTLTVMVRRDAMPATLPPGFDRLRGVDDYPLWALITDTAKIGFIDQVTAYYRLHGKNSFASQPDELRSRQILDAMVWIANAVSPPNTAYWLEGIRQFVLRDSASHSAFRRLRRFVRGKIKSVLARRNFEVPKRKL